MWHNTCFVRFVTTFTNYDFDTDFLIVFIMNYKLVWYRANIILCWWQRLTNSTAYCAFNCGFLYCSVNTFMRFMNFSHWKAFFLNHKNLVRFYWEKNFLIIRVKNIQLAWLDWTMSNFTMTQQPGIKYR